MADCKERKRVDYKQVVSELLKRKKLFYIVLPITFVLSAIYIYSIPRMYSTETKMAPEAENQSSGGALSSLASSFGFDLSNVQSNDAITPLLYPELMDDNGFVAGLFDIKVSSKDGKINTRWVLSIPFFISCIRQQNPLTVLSKVILRKVKQFNLPPQKK